MKFDSILCVYYKLFWSNNNICKFIMLFGIIGTIDRGNFVFDRWPRTKQLPKIKGCIQAGQLSQKLIEHFYYFGILRKNSVLQMSAAAFSESCIIEIFNANEKRLEVVLGIDDECVMVSRSVFITNNQNSFGKNPAVSITTNLFVFEDLQEDKKDIVNSVTLLWKAQNFEQADNIKNKLSFMVGALRHMQQSEDYLSKQVVKITQAKNNFEKKLKEKCLQLNKDSSLQMEEFKVKQIFQQFYELADEELKEIQIFKQLQKFYNSCVKNEEYVINSQSWAGSVSSNFKIPSIKIDTGKKVEYIKPKESKESEEHTNMTLGSDRARQEIIDIMLKTTLATEKKLEMLPEALKDSRINRLYTSVLNINDLSLQDVLWREKSLSVNGALQTIEFIKQNQMGLNVYPFDLKKYYNLYALRCMPSWALVKKFDSKIFPRESILKQIHPFGKFKRINLLDQKYKYIILQNIIKEVDVYIYYIETLRQAERFDKIKHFKFEEQQEDEQNENFNYNVMVNSHEINEIEEYARTKKYNLLSNYVNKCCSLNQILREEPEFGKISEVLKLVIQKMQKKRQSVGQIQNVGSQQERVFNKPKWGFYYVQNP